MVRVKRGVVTRRKHKKILKKTKGYRGTRSRLIKVAKEAALHAGAYAYHGRKLRKRDMRSLWITRISQAVKQEGLSYSVFIKKLKDMHIELDRKMLSVILSEDPDTFKHILQKAKNS